MRSKKPHRRPTENPRSAQSMPAKREIARKQKTVDRGDERIIQKYKSHGIVVAKLVDPSVFKRPLDFSRVPERLPGRGRVPKYMRNLKLSPRLAAALGRAGELDSSVADFCRRFPYAALRKFSPLKRDIVLELMEVLTPLSAYSEAVGDWVASFPFPKLKLPEAEGRKRDRRN